MSYIIHTYVHYIAFVDIKIIIIININIRINITRGANRCTEEIRQKNWFMYIPVSAQFSVPRRRFSFIIYDPKNTKWLFDILMLPLGLVHCLACYMNSWLQF